MSVKVALMKKINEAQVERGLNNVSKCPNGWLYFVVINILELFFLLKKRLTSLVLLLMYFNSICNTRQSGKQNIEIGLNYGVN